MNAYLQLCMPCLTAAMLLLQACCLPLTATCSCRGDSHSHRRSATATIGCCCPMAASADAGNSETSHCSRCKIQSHLSAQVDQARTICHCGGHSQRPQVPDGVPGTSRSVSLSWIDATANTEREARVLECPAGSQVLRCKMLAPNSQHAMLCVWLA